VIDTALIRQRFETAARFLDERGRRLVAALETAAAVTICVFKFQGSSSPIRLAG
jgi:hypothetical protein